MAGVADIAAAHLAMDIAAKTAASAGKFEDREAKNRLAVAQAQAEAEAIERDKRIALAGNRAKTMGVLAKAQGEPQAAQPPPSASGILDGVATGINADDPEGAVNGAGPPKLTAGGPQPGGPNPQGGGGAGGDLFAPVPDAPAFTTDVSTRVQRNEVLPGVSIQEPTTQFNVRENALTPGQVLQARQRQALAQRASREAMLDRIAGASEPVFNKFRNRLPAGVQEDLDLRRSTSQQERKNKSRTTLVYDPTSPTGRRVIRTTELPNGGQFAPIPAKSQVEVNLNEQPATKTMRTKLQTNLNASLGSVDRLNQISNSFDPTFLTAPMQMALTAATKVERVTGTVPLGMREQVAKFANFKQSVQSDLNLYIKEITGAQMSASEAERLIKTRPNLDDSPTEFVSKFNTTIATLRLNIARQHMLMRDGFGDETIKRAIEDSSTIDSLYGQVSLDRTLQVMDARESFHTRRLNESGGLSPEQITRLAEEATERDFGLRE